MGSSASQSTVEICFLSSRNCSGARPALQDEPWLPVLGIWEFRAFRRTELGGAQTGRGGGLGVAPPPTRPIGTDSQTRKVVVGRAWWGSGVGTWGWAGRALACLLLIAPHAEHPTQTTRAGICSRAIPVCQHRLFGPHANIQKLPCAFSKDRIEQHRTSQRGFVYTFVNENGKSQDTSITSLSFGFL